MSVQYIGSGAPDGVCLGQSGEKVGFYGQTPIVIRSGAAQGTALVGTASSTAVNTDMKAALIEVMNTLTALKLWTGAA